MKTQDIFHLPIFRILFFLALVGLFFYRDFPGATAKGAKWKWYVGVSVYWVVIAFFYYGISAMMGAGLYEILAQNSTPSPALAYQVTITSLGLLFLYRLFSRYIPADESTKWLAEFIQGVITTYVAVNALVYGFIDYLERIPRLEAFSGTATTYIVWAILFALDLGLWLMTRKTIKSPGQAT